MTLLDCFINVIVHNQQNISITSLEIVIYKVLNFWDYVLGAAMLKPFVNLNTSIKSPRKHLSSNLRQFNEFKIRS